MSDRITGTIKTADLSPSVFTPCAPGDGIAASAREAILQDYADRFLHQIAHLHGREFAIARTKIEEAVMWAVKGLKR